MYGTSGPSGLGGGWWRIFGSCVDLVGCSLAGFRPRFRKVWGDPRYDSRCIPELKDLRNLVGVLPQITIAIVILNMDTPHSTLS